MIGEIGQEAGGEEEDVVVVVVLVAVSAAAAAEEVEGNKNMLGVRLIIGMARVWNE